MSTVALDECVLDYRMDFVDVNSPCQRSKARLAFESSHRSPAHEARPIRGRMLSPCGTPGCQMERIIEMDMHELAAAQSPTYAFHLKKSFYPQQVHDSETDFSQIPCYDYDAVNEDCEVNRDCYTQHQMHSDMDKYSLGYESGHYSSDFSKYTPEYENGCRLVAMDPRNCRGSCCSDAVSTSRSCEKIKIDLDSSFCDSLPAFHASHSCEKIRPHDDDHTHQDSRLYKSVKVRKHQTSARPVTPVGILWTLLSILVAGTCSFSFLQPFWFIQPQTLDSFGMFSYCIRNLHLHRHHSKLTQACGIYGGQFHFSNLPSHSWQAACVLFGGGCVMHCTAALLAICSLCMPRRCNKRLSIASGYMQLMAGEMCLLIHFLTPGVAYTTGLPHNPFT